MWIKVYEIKMNSATFRENDWIICEMQMDVA